MPPEGYASASGTKVQASTGMTGKSTKQPIRVELKKRLCPRCQGAGIVLIAVGRVIRVNPCPRCVS